MEGDHFAQGRRPKRAARHDTEMPEFRGGVAGRFDMPTTGTGAISRGADKPGSPKQAR